MGRWRKRGQVKLEDVHPTFDLSLSWELESPSFYPREEANHRVEPVTIRDKDRIDARIDEKTRSLEERRRKAHSAGQANLTSAFSKLDADLMRVRGRV